MGKTETGVLLLNFGCPSCLDEVEPFVVHIRQGKKIPTGLIDKIKERYAQIGGGSPLLSVTRSQAVLLSEELKREGKNYPVCFGMLHSAPFIFDAVQQMAEKGMKRILAVSLTPFDTKASTGAYYSAVEKAVESGQYHITISYGDLLYANPFFIEAVAEKTVTCLNQFPDPEEVSIIFTTHSLPQDNPEDAEDYRKQFQAAVDVVINRVEHRKFHLAYQSKGIQGGNWLGPQVEEVIESLAAQGEKHVLVVPIGFISDHMETLYDLDIEIKKRAESLGMNFRRCQALNDSPLLIKALVSAVLNI